MSDVQISFSAINSVTGVIEQIKGQLKSLQQEQALSRAKTKGQTDALMERFRLEGQLTTQLKSRAAMEAKNTAILKKQRQEMRALNTEMARSKAATREFRGTMLGLGFGLLFTGMAIQRFTDKALRGIIDVYAKVMGDTSEFAIITNTLSANWTFFKFTLMDALMQSGLFNVFMGFLLAITQWLAGLPEWVKVGLMVMVAAIVLASTASMILGQFVLLLAVNWKAVGANIKAVSKYMKALPWGPLLIVGIIVGLIIALFKLWTIAGDKVRKVITSLGLVTGTLGTIMIIVGASFGWWILLIALAVLAIAFFKEEIMQFGIAVLTIFNQMIKWSLWPFLATIQLIIDGVYLMINAWLRWKATQNNTKFKKLIAPQVKGDVLGVFDGMQEALADWDAQLKQPKVDRGGFWERLGFGSSEDAHAKLSTSPSQAGAVTNVDNSVSVETVEVKGGESSEDLVAQLRELQRQVGGSPNYQN